ncbi:MAG: peroxiredoxin family protein [Zhongshania sp.]|uniref:peroxiredoxin family protein n=1 Tax=Zhongshania sp. TaxID=1971902 RepID=UPI00261C51AE|nr:peroxiredoxin family protein [Zhongshania sp.]MDF1691937.1 peroxiredoxin family protein [Zhongshania sp.]
MIKTVVTLVKRWYAIPYLLLCSLVSIQSVLYLLGGNDFSLSWLGSAVALVPLVVFIGIVYFLPWIGIAHFIAIPVVAVLFGSFLAVIEMRAVPTFYTLFFGLGGVLAYIFWYSYLDRGDNQLLRIGAKLPDFSVRTLDGEILHSTAFLGRKTLLVFYRGNWCPACQVQLRELAAEFEEIQRRGVSVVLISPQAPQRSAAQARRFKVGMQFCIDEGNLAARSLGIAHRYGVPLGILGYGQDTVLPTALIVDERGKIVYADLTENFRVRPKAKTLISALDSVWM